jgi:ABC-2 type transport system permease protein
VRPGGTESDRLRRLGPGSVVAVQTSRRAARSGALWGLVFGAYVASSSVGYAAIYPAAAARAKLAASLGGNSGLAALLGPARHLDTVTGFTAWRTMAVLAVVGAIWALFLSTRLLRGEEDAGRWELYLCGQTTRGRAAAEGVVGMATGVAALWAVTAALTLAAGAAPKVHFPVAGSLYLATCLVSAPAMFVAVGAFISELAANRRQANILGAAVIGSAFLIRMVADSTSSLVWLRWASPLGWTEQLRPLTGSQPVAFVPIAIVTALAAMATVLVAARRDLGASILPSQDTPASHTALVGSATGLAVRLTRSVAIGWAVAVGVMGLVLGLVAQSAAGTITGSAAVSAAIRRLGGHGTGAKAYLGLAFSTVAALVSFAAAGQINATRAEEASAHLDHILVRPVSRARWLVGRIAVATALVVAISVLSGIASWLGTAVQGGGVGLGELLAAGLNVAPPALLVLGLGVLAFGLLPRVASWFAYALVAWSFLVQLIATFVTGNRLLLDSSVLAHVAPAPAARPDWSSAAALVLLGALTAGAGVIAFDRRDLAGE